MPRASFMVLGRAFLAGTDPGMVQLVVGGAGVQIYRQDRSHRKTLATPTG